RFPVQPCAKAGLQSGRLLRNGPWALACAGVTDERPTLLESVTIGAAGSHDPPESWARKVRREQAGAALGVLLDQACPSLARQFRVGAGQGRPLWLQQ